MKLRLSAFTTVILLFLGLSAHASEHRVTQKNKEFSKEELMLYEGDAVIFKNDDSVVHNLFSKEFDFNVTQDPGEETKVKFERTGKSVVRCAIHPKMKLTVRVVE